MKTIIIGALCAILAGCASQQPPETTTPVPAIYEVQGVPVVCLSEPHDDAERWRAMCAPIGDWMPCAETAETLRCLTGQQTRSFQ